MGKKDKKESRWNIWQSLKEETVQSVLAIIFFVLAVFFGLAAIGKANPVGGYVYAILGRLVGFGYFLIPILLTFLGISFLQSLKKSFAFAQVAGVCIFFLSGLGIIDLVAKDRGGFIGRLIALPLLKLFDYYATLIFLAALLLISTLVIFDIAFRINLKPLWEKLKRKRLAEKSSVSDAELEKLIEKQPESEQTPKKETGDEKEKTEKKKETAVKKFSGLKENEEEGEELRPIKNRLVSVRPYTPPPLTLLERDSGKPGVGDIKANANIIKRTLQNFGITVEMDEISIGPSVTRYALKPAEGMKLSRIVALQNDLALALAAHPIRIEAPIPGKSLVGIEIPNSIKTTVGLGSLLASEEYQTSDKPLLISLGRGIAGKSHFGDLAKMPHLLLAGATGSGKSVAIHSIITSLLYRNSPENLKFIMIDPKRVELTLYNKTPHLLTPVVTDPKKAILSLKWAAKEMDRRYDILEAESVRDIESYHKNIVAGQKLEAQNEKNERGDEERLDIMPYIIIVIDELADIMQIYPRELESAVVRLAQMSRAVGIHLIVSTQRPSVDIITGLIKANIPARIALQVASQVDSRTILDMAGAEKLLGAGDMLYLSGEMSKPQRIQSSFISEAEVKKVVKYLALTYEDEVVDEINLSRENARNSIFDMTFDDSEATEDDDELYEEAREIVVAAGKASTSYLQRKLRIGYARAARLIDILEERGVVSSGYGAKPREVIGYQDSSYDDEKNKVDI